MMSTASATNGRLGRNKFPFTATQYQELEHQAMIFKYMSAGIPIPPELLFSIKTSLHSPFSSKLFPFHSPPLGWNPYQMGYGKKIDPEPGRCRRTDGKKWRCSKEAYTDSKYCERHMHRGKNRSRKPVESPLSINNNNNTSTTNVATSLSNQSLFSNNYKDPSNSSLYSFSTSDNPSYNANNANLLYNNTSTFGQKDYRERYYHQGLKEDVGEHAFFRDSSESNMRGFSNGSSQLSEKQSGGFPSYFNGSSTRQEQDKQCYIWGRDFNCELSMKVEEEKSNLNEKTTHHFFDDLPSKNDGGFRDNDSSSTTQLSISIPSSTSNHHDFLRNL